MLDGMRRAMGDDAFFTAARDFFVAFKDKGAGTEDFRAFWTARLRGDAKRLGIWLDTDGGLPKP